MVDLLLSLYHKDQRITVDLVQSESEKLSSGDGFYPLPFRFTFDPSSQLLSVEDISETK
jgi:hypothetical protein